MEPLTPGEQAAVDAVDPEKILALLEDLIAFPSVANAESAAQRRMEGAMQAAGLETDLWDIDFDSLKKHPAYTSDVQRSEGIGLVGVTPNVDPTGPTLILNGHIDVVPAGDEARWAYPPYALTRRGDQLFGRGVVDMKGALCCAVETARALRDAGVELAGTLQVQSVIAEEDGGAGTLATIERGYTGDGAIVLEPTQQILAPAQAGALSFRLTVPGRAAHGAFREEGVDPLEKFYPIFQALRGLEAARNHNVADPLFRDDELPYALTMGRMQSGIWPSTVAESLTVEGRYGVAPGESLDQARAEFEAAVSAAAGSDDWLRDHPPTVEWCGAQFSAARTADHAMVVAAVADSVTTVTGAAPRRGGVRFGADMRLLVNQADIPTVLYGPGDVRDAHRPDETVRLSDLVTVTRVLVVTAMRFCGTR